MGIPAKSGAGGGITAAAPKKLGIGVFLPPLDAQGNSARGIQVCEAIARDFGLHPFNASLPKHGLDTWLAGSRAAAAPAPSSSESTALSLFQSFSVEYTP